MTLFLKCLQYVLTIGVVSVLNLRCSAVQDVVQLEHVNTKYVCQNDTITLRCPGPSLLEIQAARFGRDKSVICSSGANAERSCNILDKKHIVKQFCDHKTQCTFEANAGNFGNDCPDVDKYLNIIYACVRSSEMEKFFRTQPRTPTPPSTLPTTKPLTTKTTTKPSNVTTQGFNVSMNNTTPTTEPLTRPLASPYKPRVITKVPKTKIRYFNPDGPALDFLAKAGGQSSIVQADKSTHVMTLCGLGIMLSLLYGLGL